MSPKPERHVRVFPELEPPPGGLARLRARLRPRPRGRWVPAFASALTAAGIVAAVTWAATGGHGASPMQLENPAAVRLGFAAGPTEEVAFRGADGRLQPALEVPGGPKDVAIYWVAPAGGAAQR